MLEGILMMLAGYYIITAKYYVLGFLGMEDTKEEYNFWVYMIQIGFIASAYIYPLAKLALYWKLDLPWFGTDFDFIADLITMILWAPNLAFFIVTKIPGFDWNTWFPDASGTLVNYETALLAL